MNSHEAMDALVRTLGMVKRDTFDYTEWRRGMWNDMSIEAVYAEAASHYERGESNSPPAS